MKKFLIIFLSIIICLMIFGINIKSTKTKSQRTNNINTKVSFYKNEYLNRYIDYKKKNKDLSIEKVILYVNIGIDQDFFTNIKNSPYKNTNYIIANKYYYLGKDYIPNDLEKIDSKYSINNGMLVHDAKVEFEQMAKQAEEDGYTIRAISAYRSYDYQNKLYNNYVKKDGKQSADRYSARPGFSEHQTGLAVDVDNIKETYTNFGKTKEFIWMQENAYKYGFILRYTKETEFITGYLNEEWHYRYVGVNISTYIHNNPMTYEEYFARFIDKEKST